MRSVGRSIQSNGRDPGLADPRVLPSREMRRLRQPAWKEELIGLQMRVCDPGRDRVPRLFGDLKLNRSLGLLLHDNRARSNVTALYHVVHMEPDQIAPA